MEENKQDKSIFELLKKLADLECNNAKVESVAFAKKGSRLVSNKVNDMTECILENAKEYGRKIEFVSETSKIKSAIEANIIRNYTLSLEKVNKQFDIKRKIILEEKMKWKNQDTKSAMVQDYIARQRDEAKQLPEYAREKELQEQARIALDEGEYEKLESINKELKAISKINKATKYEAQARHMRAERAKIAEAIRMCDEELENCAKERRNAIELIAGKKENLLQTADKKYLLVLQNENWLQKTLGKILNKLNGGKRYTENVTNVLSKKVRDINYKSIPALKTKLQKETEEVLNKTAEITKNITHAQIEPKDNTVTKGAKYAVKGAKSVANGTKYVTKQGKKLTQITVNKSTQIAKNTWNVSKQGYSAMIEKYRSARMWSISKLEQRIATLETKEQKQQESKEIEK